MAIIRRSHTASDLVDVSSRLAGYEVTLTEGLDASYASGYTRVAPLREGAPAQIAAPSDVLTERRAGPRYALRIPVRTTPQADEPWEEGMTVDASLTGMCVEMGSRPSPCFVDMELDADVTIAAWARVVAWTPLDDGRFRWRLRLVSYDPPYLTLLDGLEPIATGIAPPLEEPALAPGDAGELVGAAPGWGPLLDRPISKGRNRRTRGNS